MSEFQFTIAIVAISGGLGVAFTWILADQWRRVRVAAYNARLKQLMIERGMSVDEVERVLAAGGNLESDKTGRCGRKTDSL